MTKQLDLYYQLNQLYKLKQMGYKYIDPQIKQQNLVPSYTIKTLKKIIDDCQLCNLSKSKTQTMFGFGNLSNARIFIILDYPTQIEDKNNNIFIDNRGVMLQKMIENVLNISLDDVFVTYLNKCKPINEPTISEKEVCFTHLEQQLQLTSAHMIISFGEDVYNYLVKDNREKFSDIVGQNINFYNKKLFAMQSLQKIQQNPSLKKEMFYHLNHIKGLL